MDTRLKPAPRGHVQDVPRFVATSGAIILVAVLVIYPLIVFLLTSFRLHSEMGPGALTIQNYLSIFSSRVIVGALRNTIVISTAVAACAGILGTFFAWLHARVSMPGLRYLEPLTVMPFFLSPLLGAIAWWILASPKIGILNHCAMKLFGLADAPFNIYSLEGIVLVMTLYYTPYIYLFTSGSFRRMDPALEESARICGTGIIRTALKVGIPLSTPAILSGFLIIFVISAGAFGVPIILGVPARIHTLSTRIFTMMEVFPPDMGGAAAVGGLLILLTAGGIWFQRRVVSKKSYITVTGKGYRPQRMMIGRWAYVALALNLLYILFAILIPLGALLLASLNRVWLGSFRWDQTTLAHWRNILFENDLARRSIVNSFILGVGGALLSVILCTLLAYLIYRGRNRFRVVLDYLVTMPVGVPGIVMGMAFLIAWIRTPLYGLPLLLLVIAYMTRYLPYGVRTVSSALLSISPELEESSQVCGAPFLMTLRRVTVPLLRPGMLSAYILLFIVFFREYPVSLLLYTEKSMPMAIAVYIILDNQPLGVAAAFALLQTILLLGAALLFRRIAGEQELRV